MTVYQGTMQGKKPRVKKSHRVITAVLILYVIITLIPFYFLFVRSFVATKDSTRLHLWIPPGEEVNMDYRLGNLATYYNLDMDAFKEKFGLTGYLSPEKQPVTALINSLSGTYATNYQAMFSGLFMSVLPLLVVYLCFQDLFVRSSMAGAVKG